MCNFQMTSYYKGATKFRDEVLSQQRLSAGRFFGKTTTNTWLLHAQRLTNQNLMARVGAGLTSRHDLSLTGTITARE
jgi:hypothetical protein